MLIKRILFSLPIFMALFFLISFLMAKENFHKQVNQLILSSIGDAEKLNPVLATDSASSDINSFIFNGLVKYNENQELIGDLAESWKVEQVSTFHLQPGSILTGQEVVARLKTSLTPDDLDRAKLVEIKAKSHGDVEVFLKTAGRDFEKEIFKVIPETEFQSVEHHPIITFYLRKNVRWHDGYPFTAEDVKFTYDTIMDEKTMTVRRPMFELVQHVNILDPYRVQVVYKKPFSPSLESWGIGMIPKHILEGQDINTAPFNRHPIGTGPFKFKEWIADEKITLIANEDYFEGRPYLDQISYRIIPESSLAEMEFAVEGVDYYEPQPHQVRRFLQDDRYAVYRRLSNAYTYIGWNQRVDLFKDKRVRQALTYATDRQKIVENILYGLGVVSTGPFPPQMWYFNPHVKPLEYNLDKARELLAESGWKDTDGDGILDKDGKPFKFSLITNNGNVARQNIAVLVQRQLKELGIQVEIALYEWAVFIRDRINTRNFEACVLGWSLGLDPDIYEIWHSSQIKDGFNFVGYQNPEVDALIEAGRTEYDREKRKEIYRKIQALIYEDQPYTFLYVPEEIAALHKGEFKIKRVNDQGEVILEDISMTPVGLFYHLNKWYRTGGTLLKR